MVVVALLAIANRQLKLRTAEYLVFLGAGLSLAHVVLGAIIAVFGLNAPELLQVFFTMVLVLGAAAVCAIAYSVRLQNAPLTKSIVWPQVVLCLFLLAIYFAWRDLPAQAWDSLDSWLMQAGRFTKFVEVWNGGSPYFYDQRHPFTVSALAASTVWTGAATEIAGLTMSVWSIAYCSMALVCFGYARYWQVDTKIATLAAFAVLTTPLVENHYLLFGYADIWSATVLVSAIALFSIGLSSQKKTFIVLGFLLLLALAAVKNTGAVFSAALFLVIVLMRVLPKLPFRLFLAFGLVLPVLVILSVERGSPEIKSVFDVRLDGNELEISNKRCTPAAFDDKFLVTVVPNDPEDLEPLVTKWVAAKYPGLDFKTLKKQFSSVSSSDGTCEFNIELGAYDKKLIRVGQLSNTNHPNWMGILIPGATQYSIPAIDISMQVGDRVVISAIGRYMILELRSPADVGKNFLYAHFVNSSYTLWTLLLLLSTAWYYFGHKRLTVWAALPLFAVWSLLGLLLCSQVFIVDFFNTSLPDNDTRYSRFILWLPATVLLVAAPLLSARELTKSSQTSPPVHAAAKGYNP